MKIPSSADPHWADVISGKLTRNFEFLASKIIIGRLGVVYKVNPTQETMAKCISDLINFFSKNQTNPKACNDLARIFE